MKAILVIEMPDSCFHCTLEHYGHQCGANHENTAGNANKRPSWCPLKPMPQKKGKYGEPHEYDTDIHYEIGWNECIAKITGETE